MGTWTEEGQKENTWMDGMDKSEGGDMADGEMDRQIDAGMDREGVREGGMDG